MPKHPALPGGLRQVEVLSMLSDGNEYSTAEIIGRFDNMARSSAHAALAWAQRHGYVEFRWDTSGRRPTKHYRLTASGREALTSVTGRRRTSPVMQAAFIAPFVLSGIASDIVANVVAGLVVFLISLVAAGWFAPRRSLRVILVLLPPPGRPDFTDVIETELEAEAGRRDPWVLRRLFVQLPVIGWHLAQSPAARVRATAFVEKWGPPREDRKYFGAMLGCAALAGLSHVTGAPQGLTFAISFLSMGTLVAFIMVPLARAIRWNAPGLVIAGMTLTSTTFAFAYSYTWLASAGIVAPRTVEITALMCVGAASSVALVGLRVASFVRSRRAQALHGTCAETP
jgi:hypothetical protein